MLFGLLMEVGCKTLFTTLRNGSISLLLSFHNHLPVGYPHFERVAIADTLFTCCVIMLSTYHWHVLLTALDAYVQNCSMVYTPPLNW